MTGRDVLLVVLCMGIICATVEAVFRRPPYDRIGSVKHHEERPSYQMEDVIANQANCERILQGRKVQEMLQHFTKQKSMKKYNGGNAIDKTGAGVAKPIDSELFMACLKKLTSKKLV